MREELRQAVRGLLEHLPGSAYDKGDVRIPIIALPQYVALARSPVDRDSQLPLHFAIGPRQDAGSMISSCRWKQSVAVDTSLPLTS